MRVYVTLIGAHGQVNNVESLYVGKDCCCIINKLLKYKFPSYKLFVKLKCLH